MGPHAPDDRGMGQQMVGGQGRPGCLAQTRGQSDRRWEGGSSCSVPLTGWTWVRKTGLSQRPLVWVPGLGVPAGTFCEVSAAGEQAQGSLQALSTLTEIRHLRRGRQQQRHRKALSSEAGVLCRGS